MLKQCGLDDLVDRLERGGNHRVLRRLNVPAGITSDAGEVEASSIGLVVDVETTGTDPNQDVIIELAMRRFRWDEDGRIVHVGRRWSWLEDPGRPLELEIVRLTGLNDSNLIGQSIDDKVATRLLRSADLVIAHNAAFDRKFIERRLPEARGQRWACSCVEVDWPAAGFDGRALGWLLAQAGWFHDGHRAENDVDAVIALLRHELPDMRTVLADLIDSSSCPSIRVEAVGADFSVKEALKARGYRWDPADRVWWTVIQPNDLVAEEFWLARNVYAPEHRPRAFAPRLTELTARERYA